VSNPQQGELAPDKDAVELIDECKQRMNYQIQAWGTNRTDYESDKRFVSGGPHQWDPQDLSGRRENNRPCLTVNLTDAICRRVVNACRENRPRIVVHPVSNGADVQTADVLDGLIRHIEYRSSAAYAYDSAVENAVHGGFGFISLDGDYASDTSFDQELSIGAYSNPLICYMDPNSRLPDGSDMDYFIESSFMKRTEYRIKYGALDSDGWKWAGPGDDMPDWSNKEEIRIAKYWRVERKKGTLYRYVVPGPTPRLDSGFEVPAGAKVVQERPSYKRIIRCYLMTGFKVMKSTTWPGKWIPRVPVYGRRLDLNGRITTKGMVRDLQDPARLYNYSQTAKTESYAMQAKVVWFGPEGFTEGHENAFRDMNRKPIVVAEYKPTVGPDGQRDPPPMKVEPPSANQGFAEWGDSTKSDFLAVAGMPHDPDVDKKGEVVSGIALRKRQGIADVSNYDFYDNLTRSLNHLGRIIVDVVPYFYDTPRIIRIIGEDGQAEQTAINQKIIDPMTQAVLRVHNDLTVGEYEVVIDTGPSYQTKREESSEKQLELLTTPLGELIASSAGDLVVRSLDFANSDSIADRLMAMTPAAQMDKVQNMQPDQLKAMVAGLQQQLQQERQKGMALELEMQAKHGLEQMKQDGENKRLLVKQHAETLRQQMKDRVSVEDTHVRAATAHNVAEIGGAVQLMNAVGEHSHEKEMFIRQASHEMEMGDRGFLQDLAQGAQSGHQAASSQKSEHEHAERMAERSEKHESTMAKSKPKPKG
jgi:Phage P22-like portal protein